MAKTLPSMTIISFDDDHLIATARFNFLLILKVSVGYSKVNKKINRSYNRACKIKFIF